MSAQAPPDWIRVASIVSAHGVAGEIRVELLGGDASRLRPGDEVRVGSVIRTIESLRGAGERPLCRLSGVADRDQARALSGAYLEMPAAQIRSLPEGEYFHFQLVGLKVVDPAGNPRGELVDVETYPAHDVYVVASGQQEVRVPAVREAVLEVDLKEQRVMVAPGFLEGWVDAD